MLPKIYSRQLIEATFMQPYARIETLIESGIAKRQTASTYLKSLPAMSVLEERVYGRDKLFVDSAFAKLLTGDDHPSEPAAGGEAISSVGGRS